MATSGGTAAAVPGARVGQYELLLPIGKGGMARVYLARVVGPGGFERLVALKLVHEHLRDEPAFRAELLEEAKLAARLRHANIVPVIDAGEDAAGVFLVMDYVEGDVLSGLIRAARAEGQSPPLSIALRLWSDAVCGLHAAHELRDESGSPLGVVHRDFSPQNILVGVDGVARLTDFGIAKRTSQAGSTRTGLIKGKVGYMSPEQARGRPLDRRSDIWSAGVVAWELFAGQSLFAEGDDIATLFRIVSEAPRRLGTVRSDVGAEVEQCLARALDPDVEARFATAEELRRELLAAYGRPLAEPSDVARYVERVVGSALSERRAALMKQAATGEGDPTTAEPVTLERMTAEPERASSQDAVTVVRDDAARVSAVEGSRTKSILPRALLVVAAAALLVPSVLVIFDRGAGSSPAAAASAGTANPASTEAPPSLPSSAGDDAPSLSSSPASAPPTAPSSSTIAPKRRRPRHASPSPRKAPSTKTKRSELLPDTLQ